MEITKNVLLRYYGVYKRWTMNGMPLDFWKACIHDRSKIWKEIDVTTIVTTVLCTKHFQDSSLKTNELRNRKLEIIVYSATPTFFFCLEWLDFKIQTSLYFITNKFYIIKAIFRIRNFQVVLYMRLLYPNVYVFQMMKANKMSHVVSPTENIDSFVIFCHNNNWNTFFH